MVVLGDGLLRVPPFGIGMWGWGDVITYGWGPSKGYDPQLNEKSIREVFDRSLEVFHGKTFFDTAEHYGYTNGQSEQFFGQFQEEMHSEKSELNDGDRNDFVFATKYLPTPWRHPWRYPGIMLDSLKGSLSRTRLGKIDIYQLHGPSNLGIWPTFHTLADALCDCYHSGRIKAIGVCNLDFDTIKYIYSYLRKRGVPLVTSQVEFSLCRTDPWSTGLIDKCKKLGIATIAYSVSRIYSSTNLYSP
jgi:pyridoxine 4-dehydrogenase